MWRAFFYAVGYMTIFLGLQSLAFEQVQLAPGKDAMQIIKRIIREDGGRSGVASAGRSNQSIQAQTLGSASESSFGPSRFSNGGFGGSNFSAAPYRDLSQNGRLGVGSGQAVGVPRVDLTGYQTEVKQTQLRPTTKTPGRVIQSKDWMPWSLLATGFVIVLYTRSFAARS